MHSKGWSEYRLAKEADLSQSTISHMFKRNNAPTLPTITAVCDAFGLTLSQFFADESEAVSITDEQKELLLLFGSLTQEQKQLLKDIIRQFGNQHL